jgi:hypothetical protein
MGIAPSLGAGGIGRVSIGAPFCFVCFNRSPRDLRSGAAERDCCIAIG